jgi:hypothetical protein
VSADEAREAARQSAHNLAAAQAETARVRADAAEVRRLLELTREAAEEQRRLGGDALLAPSVRAAIRAQRQPQQVNRSLAIERAARCTERGREALQLLRV